MIWRNMLTEDAKDSRLFKEVDELVGALSLRTVEVTDSVHQGTHHMRVVVFKPEGEVDTDDLSAVYNIIYPRYSVIFGDRDLELEVSSPGLQRSFKDTLEFSIFTSRLVRVYSLSLSSYVTGTIERADEDSVTLGNAEIEGNGEKRDGFTLPYSDIAKAKLEYRWEA